MTIPKPDLVALAERVLARHAVVSDEERKIIHDALLASSSLASQPSLYEALRALVNINANWSNPTLVRTFARKALKAIAALPADGGEVDDETYEIGKRDGYESAIQDLDVATGGDGEFKGSTIPGGAVDVPAMKARIIHRVHDAQAYADLRASGGIFPEAYVTPSTAGSVREAARLAADELVEVCEAAHRVAKRTGNTFVLDRERVAGFIAARFAALSAPVEAPVAVKSLEWVDLRGMEQAQAHGPFGFYVVENEEGWGFRFSDGPLEGCFAGPDAAKAAAQADFEQRIRSALIATERPLPSVEEAWQQLLDKDDRTSPEEYPDMCLITFDELKSLLGGSAR